MTQKYKYLHFVDYSTFLLWDIKRYFMTQVSSSYPIVRLGDYIQEESAKYKINDPSKTYGILGVNNQTGIFDAYREQGSNIKQKYKKMQVGWIAYNPYRVNVGSIGMRTDKQNYEYISPAYVVFSCKEKKLSPEFLYLLMKTDVFNQIIRENTTGSVRQNLNYSVLSNLQIPLPSLDEQNNIVAAYNSALAQSALYARQAQDIDSQIEAYLQDILGIQQTDTATKRNAIGKFLWLVNSKDIICWDVYNVKTTHTGKYDSVYLSEIISKLSTGTTPPTHNKEYFAGGIDFYTPADINGDMYLGDAERHISQSAIEDKKARLFSRGDLLFVGIGSTVGKVGLVSKDVVSSNQQITGITFNTSRIMPEYAFVYMHYFKESTTADKSKTTLPIINQEKIGQIQIPLPPLVIQNEIVSHISSLRAERKALQQQSLSLRSDAQHQFTKTIFN